MEHINKIKNLIANNRIEAALAEMDNLEISDEEKLSVVMFRNEHKEIKRKVMLGIDDGSGSKRNQLIYRMLTFLDAVKVEKAKEVIKEIDKTDYFIKLIESDLEKSLEELFNKLGKSNGNFIDLYNEFISRSNNFNRSDFRERLKGFVRLNL